MEEGLQVNHRDVLLPFDFLSFKGGYYEEI